MTERLFDTFGFPLQSQSVNNDSQYIETSFEPIRGNLNYRMDAVHNLREDFSYDFGFNRLIEYQVLELDDTNSHDPLEVCYNSSECTGTDQAGNIMYKTDVGEYTYGDAEKPNAVTQVTDPNNLISISADQYAIYNGFNSVESITQGNLLLNFSYGVDQQRRKSELYVEQELVRTRYYIGNFEKQITPEGSTEVTYINSPSGSTAMHVKNEDGEQFYFTYTDHLGSILEVTDINGTIVASQNFDPYGRHRDPLTWSYLEESPMTDGSLPVWLWRGYTGHEHMDEFGLINMNGRLYDPLLARMLSPDNYVQDPENPQSYNRYSYVWNNPLKYVDPLGELVIDPLAHLRESLTPYNFVRNNPIMRNDPDGALDAPIFGTDGELLGTDNEGWTGDAIVMNKKDFKQGMEHGRALDKGTELKSYGKGISISNSDWNTVKSNGGTILNPFVENNSTSTIYYKPDGIDNTTGNDLNPGYNSSLSYPIGAGKDLYAPIDGVKTDLYKNVVFKVTDYNKVNVNANGHVFISHYDGSYFKQVLGGGWLRMTKYNDWKNLRERKIGQKIYIPWQYKW